MATKKIKLTTPAGVAVYPRLSRPDTKYHEYGVYKADVRIPIEEAKPLLNEIGKIYKQHVGEAHPKLPRSKDKEAVWYYELDDEGDVIKDHVIFKLRAKNVKTSSGDIWDRKPRQFDARKNLIKNGPTIGGGTIMKVSFEVDCYNTKSSAGLRLVPLAVQILDLVEYDAGGSAEDFGFEEEEGWAGDTDDFDNDNNNNEEEDADSEEDSEEEFY